MAPRTARSLTLWTVLAAATFAFAVANPTDHIDPRTGVPIKFALTPSMFPESWHYGEIQATAITISPNQVNRSVVITNRAMSKYPADLLTKNLKAVYFVKEMRFYGLKYGGTNSRDTIYITNRGLVSGFSDQFVEATFHHEFSSILLRNYRGNFDTEKWIENNRADSRYGVSGMHALKEGKANTNYDPDYHIRGFLNEYAQASMEEDFNTFAEALFGGDRDFWRVVALFPRIEKKKDAIIAFFHSVDPIFDEGYFLRLAG